MTPLASIQQWKGSMNIDLGLEEDLEHNEAATRPQTQRDMSKEQVVKINIGLLVCAITCLVAAVGGITTTAVSYGMIQQSLRNIEQNQITERLERKEELGKLDARVRQLELRWGGDYHPIDRGKSP